MPFASTIVRECWNSRETAPNLPLFYWYYDTYLGIPGFFRTEFSAFPRQIPRISMDNTRLKIETPQNSKSRTTHKISAQNAKCRLSTVILTNYFNLTITKQIVR